jgi:hypothetical protein
VLCNEEFHDLYLSPNNERVIISNEVMWVGHEVLWAKRQAHVVRLET